MNESEESAYIECSFLLDDWSGRENDIMKYFPSVVVFIEHCVRIKEYIRSCMKKRVCFSKQYERKVIEVQSVNLSLNASLAAWIACSKELVDL